MAFKVEMIKNHDVKVGRGIVALKAGWSGSVVKEVYDAVIDAKTGVDVTPNPRKKKAKGADD